MAIRTTTTHSTVCATLSRFSVSAFEEILMRMEYTSSLYSDLKHVAHGNVAEVDFLQERAAESWAATEASAFDFLRSHTGKTAVPMLVETVCALVELLDLETGEFPSLQDSMNAALFRRAKAPKDSVERALLDRAVPQIFSVATLQSEMFGLDEACVAA